MNTIEKIRLLLERFVEVRSKDLFVIHLRQIFLFDNEERICGSFEQRKIKLWISSNRIIGAFYPVAQVKFDEEQTKVRITASMNSVGLALSLLINVFIGWSAFHLFILKDNLTGYVILIRIFVFIVFIGIFNLPIFMSYKGARDVIMNEILALLKKDN